MRRIRHGFYSNVGIKTEEVVDRFNLTAADLITSHSVPVTLIPAPGANKGIVVKCVVLQFKWGTIQFTGAGTPEIVYHGATTNLLSGVFTNASMIAAANSLNVIDQAGGPISVTLNTGVDFYSTIDFAAGDSTVDVTIWYSVYQT